MSKRGYDEANLNDDKIDINEPPNKRLKTKTSKSKTDTVTTNTNDNDTENDADNDENDEKTTFCECLSLHFF